MLLFISGNVHLNPGPLTNESNCHYLGDLSFVHLNVRSIRNKLDIISSELSNYDILCFTETHLNPHINNSEITIESHPNIIRNDRTTNYGGGICIFTKNNVHVSRRTDLETEDIELIILEINTSNKRLFLCCLYRPPNTSVEFWDKLDTIFENLINTNHNIIITGDINVDMLKLQRNSHLKRLMTKYQLTNLVNSPTRITNTSATLIDILLTNNTNIFNYTEVLAPLCSDHCPVLAHLCFKILKNKPFKRTIYLYDQANWDTINNELLKNNWDTVFSEHENILSLRVDGEDLQVFMDNTLRDILGFDQKVFNSNSTTKASTPMCEAIHKNPCFLTKVISLFS